MTLGRNTVLTILKNEGISVLLQTGLRRFKTFLQLPVCYFKVKSFSTANEDSLLDFAFYVCNGYIKPAQVRSEFSMFMSLARNENVKIVLEIGTARGGSLFLLSRVLTEDSYFISVDLPRGSFGGGYPFWKIPLLKILIKKNQKLTLIRKNSHDIKTFNKVKDQLNGALLDLLFIDGEHTYNGVKTDFELYRPLVKPGGLIAFHDIAPNKKISGVINCDVDVFWQEIKDNFEHKEFIEDIEQNWAGIGVIRV